MDEQRLERALRQGPPFATRYAPSSLALDEQPIVRSPFNVGRLSLLIAVTALLLVGMLAGLAALGAFRNDDRGASNGWVAFARGLDPSAGLGERDIYLVREGQAAHRIIGSDSDDLDQICPAFSSDGARLAHGEAEGTGDTGYRDAALVISDVNAAGNAAESLRIDVGGTLPPPCANWSPDGRQVAFGVPNRGLPAIWSDVWVVTLEGLEIDVVSDVFASDLEWSPDGLQLAIASGHTGPVDFDSWRNGAISLYSADSGEVRTLGTPSGVWSLSWSPDGTRIAFERDQNTDHRDDQEIWVAEVDGSAQHLVASGFSVDHGNGPVWSPAGDWIAYQRICDSNPSNPGAPCRELQEIVLIPSDGELAGRAPGEGEVVRPHMQVPGGDGSPYWFPFRVTWSPDGKQLLYTAEAGTLNFALLAVPVDPGSAPVVLYQGSDISIYDGDGAVPIQSWGSRVEEQP